MDQRVFNLPQQKVTRRFLRHHATLPESVLWKRLNRGQVADAKFRRQHGVGPYIVDFYCPECKLAIEIDGPDHTTRRRIEEDKQRTEMLANQGIHVLRFSNQDILSATEQVITTITLAIEERRRIASMIDAASKSTNPE